MQESLGRFKSRYIMRDFILISFIISFLITLISIAIAATTGQQSDAFFDANNPFVIYGLYSIVGIVICLKTFLRLKKYNIQLRQIIGTFSLRELPWLMLLSIFYGIESLTDGISQLTTFSLHIIAPNFAASAVESENNLLSYDTPSIFFKTLFYLLLSFSIIIIAPIVEEFILRGVLLHRFAVKWGGTQAVLISSFLFGLAHFNIYSISLGISSIFLALIYIKTQTLIVPIIFHGLHNTMVLISHIISSISYPNTSVDVSLNTLQSGLLNTGFALAILFYFFKLPLQLELLPYAANSNNSRKIAR